MTDHLLKEPKMHAEKVDKTDTKYPQNITLKL